MVTQVKKGTNSSFLIGDNEYPAGSAYIQYNQNRITFTFFSDNIPDRSFSLSDLVDSANASFANIAAAKTYLSGVLFSTVPGAAPTDIAWANVSGKPTTFAPSAHTHSATEVNIAAGTNGIVAQNLQLAIQALANRINALETAP